SHRNTDLAQRDALSFTPGQIARFVAMCRAQWGLDAAVLSTCNRTEFYIFGRPNPGIWADLKLLICTIRDIKPSLVPTPFVRTSDRGHAEAPSFTPGQIARFVAMCRAQWGLDAAVLSTCNRTEFYIFGRPNPGIWADLKLLICTIRDIKPSLVPTPFVRTADQ